LNVVPPPIAPPPSAVASRASNKIPAGICGILLGSLGIHKFILGYTGAGLIMLLVTILTCGIAGVVTHIIGLIEGIIYLCKSDEEFVRTYVDGRKEWF
jgi:TM2 domain-containing membrane protein YozV